MRACGRSKAVLNHLNLKLPARGRNPSRSEIPHPFPPGLFNAEEITASPEGESSWRVRAAVPSSACPGFGKPLKFGFFNSDSHLSLGLLSASLLRLSTDSHKFPSASTRFGVPSAPLVPSLAHVCRIRHVEYVIWCLHVCLSPDCLRVCLSAHCVI